MNKHLFLSLTAFLGLHLFAPIAAARGQPVLFVDSTSPGPVRDGTTWCSAYLFLQDALDAARASPGSIQEIRIADGIYTPDQGASRTPGDRGSAFRMVNGVAIRGGYAGCGALDPDERDIATYETVLSGDLNRDDLSGGACSPGVSPCCQSHGTPRCSNPDCEGIVCTLEGARCCQTAWDDRCAAAAGLYCDVNCNAEPNCENSLTVVAAWSAGPSTVLEGVTITAGNAESNDGRYASGGGLSNIGASSTFDRCTLKENHAAEDGGAVFNSYGSAPTFVACAFTQNTAGRGGAVYSDGGNSLFDGCQFDDNVAHAGGAIYNFTSSAIFLDCTFSRNQSLEGALSSGESGMGGAMFNGDNSSPQITRCRFSLNSSAAAGGAIRNDDYQAPNGPLLRACAFDQNSTAGIGGAISGWAPEMIVVDSIFTQNSAGLGGAIQGNGTILNCSFSRNIAAHGGAAYTRGRSSWSNCVFFENSASYNGGALYTSDGTEDPVFTNCTFTRNTSQSGGALHNVNGSPAFRNSVLWGNTAATGPEIVTWLQPTDVDPCVITLEHSVLAGGPGAVMVLSPGCSLSWAPTNLSTDPLFLASEVGNLRLMPRSPCIDAGENGAVPDDSLDLDSDGDTVEPLPVDLAGFTRLLDDPGVADTGVGIPPVVDIGAYEAGDCNGNLVLDTQDLTEGTSQDCNANSLPDECDIVAGQSRNCNFNAVPDECECFLVEAPQAELPSVAKNRYVSMSPGNTGCRMAVRVTLSDLPPPWDAWNGRTLWLGPPTEYTELGGQVLPSQAPPGYATFWGARLQCSPDYADWGSIGTIHVFHPGIVPGGTYSVSAIHEGCNTADEPSFSAALQLGTVSRWGDAVGRIGPGQPACPWPPSDGFVDVTVDVLAVLEKFANRSCAPIKARADVEPCIPDLKVNISDVTKVLDAFRSLPYPYAPGTSGCPSDPCAVADIE